MLLIHREATQVIRREATQASYGDHRPEAEVASSIDLHDILDFLRRRRSIVAGMTLLCLLLATSYILLAVPRFTADALVLIEPQKARLLQGRSVSDMHIESELVDSPVEVAQSGRVVLKVIRDLKLDEDPELNTPSRSVLSKALSFVRSTAASATKILSTLSSHMGLASPPAASGPAASEDAQRQHLIENFRENLTVRRLGLTYVLGISYTSEDPEKAARIANELANAYVTDELRGKYDAAKLVAMWMDLRVVELRSSALEADRAAQRYRAEHKIVNTGRGFVDEQQLNELNSQLILARAHTAEARAKLERVETVIRNGDAEAVVSDALRSELISRLRSRVLDAVRMAADLARRFGKDNGVAAKYREEAKGLQQSILDEFNRIASSQRSDYEVAISRERSLETSLKALIEQNMVTNEWQIVLRQLESEAHTARAVYEALLTRRKEAIEQESFPITEARIITAAERPPRKSKPRTTIILGGALCFGLVAGLSIGLLRERLDRVFRTGHQVERETGLRCLALVPRSPQRRLPARVRSRGGDRMCRQELGLLRYAVEKPDTQFAEAIRGIKVALDIARRDRPIRTLGVVSAIPNEGSSTIACNLAQIVALSGQSVLLVDADLQSSSLTRQMIGSPRKSSKKGLCDVILGRERLADVAWHDPKTRLKVLPAGGEASSNASNLLGSPGMRNFANTEGDGFDLLIFDLPPLATFVDVRAVAPAVDAFVLVTAWGQTDQDVVVRALSRSDIVYQRMLGCVLNMVDMGAIRYFDRYATGDHGASAYVRSALGRRRAWARLL